MTGEINNRGQNVVPVASRQHAESVLSVIQQLHEAQISNICQDYQRAAAEIERRGVPSEVMRRLPLLPSGAFVVTLPGLRAKRQHKPEDTKDDNAAP